MSSGKPNWRNPREVRRYLHEKSLDREKKLKQIEDLD
jgi:hypothetical protein